MEQLAAPYLAAALLLVVAGVSKALDPLSLARALRTAGVPVRGPVLVPLVRVAAAGEAVLGAAAVLSPGAVTAGLVGASYLGFTAFVLRALQSGSPLASCGCFGKVDTPPTGTHVAVTALLAAVALTVAGRPAAVAWELPLLVVTGVLGYVIYLTLAVLPLTGRRALR